MWEITNSLGLTYVSYRIQLKGCTLCVHPVCVWVPGLFPECTASPAVCVAADTPDMARSPPPPVNQPAIQSETNKQPMEPAT